MSPDQLQLAAALIKISKVRPDYAEILELRIFGRKKFAEIGNILGISVYEAQHRFELALGLYRMYF